MRASAVAVGWVLATMVVASSTARGQDAASEAAAIRQRVETYVAAYNRQDANAVANLWSDDAVYVQRDTGERIHGREAIAAMFRSVFQKDTTSRLSVEIEAIRLVTPDVAIEDGTAEIASAGEESVKSTYTAVHVKKEGTWYLDSVRETDMPLAPAASAGQLDQLGWLVGEWLDEDESATIRTRWEWAKNKHFLTSTFRVTVGDQIELEGTQIIGWDPVAGQIRSWVFDSEGGFGEGVWRRAGNQWTVETTSTLSDGSQGSAVNVYTQIDQDSFNWKSVDRQVNGVPEDDVAEVVVRRQ